MLPILGHVLSKVKHHICQITVDIWQPVLETMQLKYFENLVTI